MANIVTPLAEGDSYDTVKTKLVSIVESWRGPGAASGGNVPATWGVMRTLLNGVAALVGLAAIGASDSGASSLAKINALNDDTAGGRFSGSSLDLQFAANKAYGAPDPLTPLTVTRASSGMVEDSAGVWTSVGNNVARRSDKGLLVEEARTNGIRNNSMQGAAAGVNPTYWDGFVTVNGVTLAVLGSGVEKGLDYLEIGVTGTASSSGGIRFVADNNNQVAASQGQVWTHSAFMKLISGSLLTGTIQVEQREFASGVATGGLAGTVATLTGSIVRTSHTRTLTDVCTHVQPTYRVGIVSGETYNYVFRLYSPQLELGAFVTSPIRTTGAAATRAADAITLNNPSTYANLTEGSLLIEFQENVGSTVAGVNRIAATLLVDASNYVRVVGSSTIGKTQMAVVVSGAASCLLSSTNEAAAGQIVKTAGRWKLNDFAMRCDAAMGSPANDNLGPVPAGTFTINIGNFANNQYLGGYLRRLVLFSTAQNDAALSAMVA